MHEVDHYLVYKWQHHEHCRDQRTFFKSIPMRTFTYLQKVFTLNLTIPSVIATDISNRSVISVHSCWKWNILHWPECMSNNSLSPLKRERGRLIFAGSKSVISCVHEMWRTGPNKIPTLPSVLGASCTCDPEGTTNIYDTDIIEASASTRWRVFLRFMR